MQGVGIRDFLKGALSQNYEIDFYDSLKDLPTGTDIIIVDSATVTRTDIIDFRNNDDREIIYIVDEVSSVDHSVASAYKLTFVRVSDLIIELQKKFNQGYTQPVLTFWGVLPGVGTTTIALSLASLLASQYDLSVGVLGLNLYDPGSWAIHSPSYYLDDLKPFLSMRTLTDELLKGNTHTIHGGAHYLPGNRNPLMPCNYTEAEIKHLLAKAKEAFEVVIIDAGSSLNTFAALEALREATQIYTVITDRLYVQKRFEQQQQYVLKPLGIETENMLLIGSNMDNTRNLTLYARTMGLTPLVGIPALPDVALRAEQHIEPIKAFLDERRFRSAIHAVTEGIASSNAYAQVASTRA